MTSTTTTKNNRITSTTKPGSFFSDTEEDFADEYHHTEFNNEEDFDKRELDTDLDHAHGTENSTFHNQDEAFDIQVGGHQREGELFQTKGGKETDKRLAPYQGAPTSRDQGTTLLPRCSLLRNRVNTVAHQFRATMDKPFKSKSYFPPTQLLYVDIFGTSWMRAQPT